MGLVVMEKQNVTLSLPMGLLKKAKILAVERGKSFNEMVRELLEEEVRREEGYRRAMVRHKRLLEEGMDLGTGGVLKVTREEVHDRC